MSQPTARSTRSRDRWFRLGWRTLVVVGLSPVVLLAGAASVETAGWRLDRGWGAFAATCGACHELSRPMGFAKAPGQWRATVHAMLARRGGERPPGYVEPDPDAIVELLIRRRSADGATLFRHRCGRCHPRDAVDPYLAMDTRAAALLIDQHVRQNNHAIQLWEGALIGAHLEARTGGDQGTRGAAQLRFQQACGVCHTTTLLYRAMCEAAPESDTPDGMQPMVARMQGKAPELIAAGEVPALAAHATAICASGSPAP